MPAQRPHARRSKDVQYTECFGQELRGIPPASSNRSNRPMAREEGLHQDPDGSLRLGGHTSIYPATARSKNELEDRPTAVGVLRLRAPPPHATHASALHVLTRAQRKLQDTNYCPCTATHAELLLFSCFRVTANGKMAPHGKTCSPAQEKASTCKLPIKS